MTASLPSTITPCVRGASDLRLDIPERSQSGAIVGSDRPARAAALLEIVARIQLADSPESACRLLSVAVSEYLGATRVVVGLRRDDRQPCAVTAVSDREDFQADSEPMKLAQAALQEVIARREPACWPTSDPHARHALIAQRRFAESQSAGTLISGLFRDEPGQIHGAWMIVLPQRLESESSIVGFVRAAETLVAAALRLQLRAECGRLERAIQCGRRWLRGHRAIALAGTTAILAGAAAIPLPLHVDCACSIEPVVRRHVAAPFQGPLEESLVEPGDMVQAGQVLASMDGREIRWELAGVRAALHRAEKERAGHMATHDSGKAELARLEMEKLRLRMELLEHREQQLQIRSPIDGIVVKGDLKKSEGVPLDAGQKLFEIAPLDAMVVELLVESRDVGEVEAGMPVNFYLDASPFTRRAGIVERVQPRSEMRDNVNVFVAELRIDNDGGELRPGMRGNARITSGRSTLAWNLLRKPLGALVSWLGW